MRDYHDVWGALTKQIEELKLNGDYDEAKIVGITRAIIRADQLDANVQLYLINKLLKKYEQEGAN
ncbi:signal recognition particle GTPase [Desulfitispora alkaliphila]|uniref:hypothetical protein n=1 Tax=Desulfitispora alkaliphila TaxID=622674 RepID=UPI003D1E005B